MMNIKMNKIVCVLTALFVMACQPSKKPDSDDSKPNIIFILADDQAYNTIHALGNDEIITPSLDKLVESGVSFTNAFNMGAWNGAVCQASRTMLNTGLPVWKAEAHQNEVLHKGVGTERSWAKLMEKQGYETYMTGKWHVHMSAQKCFRNTINVRPGMPNDNWNHAKQEKAFANLAEGEDFSKLMPIGYNRPLHANDNSWSPTDTVHGGFWEGGQHWSEVLRQDAVSFINQAKQGDKPFFMYLAFNAPHDPRQAPPNYQDLYNVNALSVPKSFQALYPDKDAMGNGPSLRDAALAPFPRTEYATRVHKKEYYASISHMDAQIGAILQALEESGQTDNTYIIYTADHGLAVGEHGLFGKQNMYDHSLRPPFIFAGPGLEKGKTVAAEIYLQDAMATALDLAKSEALDSVFFKSFLPQALNETTISNYNGIYGAYLNLQRMIRKEGYKLILYPDIAKVKLFDLAADPHEIKNLANDASQKDRIKELFKDLKELQQQVGDTLDLDKLYSL